MATRYSNTLLGAAILLLSLSADARPPETTPWPSFRGGPQNQGRSPFALSTSLERSVSAAHLGGLIWATPVIDHEGRVFVGSSNKKIFALDAKGSSLWSQSLFSHPDSLIDSASLLTRDGQLVVPGGDGFLHSFDAASGELKWRFQAHGASADSHASGVHVNSFEGNVVEGPQGLLYAGSDNGDLYCLDGQGREQWFFRTGMMVWSAPAFSLDGKWLAFGSLDGNLYLLDPQSGKQLAVLRIGSDIKASVAADGARMLYFGAADGYFRAVEISSDSTGAPVLKVRWAYHVGSEIYSSAALASDAVIFGTMNGRILSLTLDGSLRWSYQTYSAVAASPLLTADGLIIVGAANGKLYVLDQASGQRLWSFSTTQQTRKVNLDSSPVLSPSGAIWVGSYRGQLHQIGGATCSAPEPHPACEFGGVEDTPTFGMNAPLQDAAVLRHESPTEGFREAPLRDLAPTSHLNLRLAAYDSQRFISEASLSASSIRIQLWKDGASIPNPRLELRWTVSSDGKTLNLHPLRAWTPGARYQLKIAAKYYRQSNWIWDRLQWLGMKPVTGELEFTISPPATVRPDLVRHPGWDVAQVYLSQPAALDTYIPAALDGQGFILKPFAVTEEDPRFLLLSLPGIPTNTGVQFLPEPARSNVLQAEWRAGALRADGEFSISAMGGTVRFTDFRVVAPIDPRGELTRGEISAVASCREINGNGSQYRFPFSLVNQVCDPWLRLIAQMNFETTPVREPSTQPAEPLVTLAPSGRVGQDLDVSVSLENGEHLPVGSHLLSMLLYSKRDKRVLFKHFLRTEISSNERGSSVRLTIPRVGKLAFKTDVGAAVFWNTQEATLSR